MSNNKLQNYDRYILFEKVGNNKQTQIYEIILSGKTVKIRHGQKGKKLGDNLQKKSTIAEARALYVEKKKQKMSEGYKTIKEHEKNDFEAALRDLNEALPLNAHSLNPLTPQGQQQQLLQQQQLKINNLSSLSQSQLPSQSHILNSNNNTNNNNSNNNNPNNRSFSFSFGGNNVINNSNTNNNNNSNRNSRNSLIPLPQDASQIFNNNNNNSNNNNNGHYLKSNNPLNHLHIDDHHTNYSMDADHSTNPRNHRNRNHKEEGQEPLHVSNGKNQNHHLSEHDHEHDEEEDEEDDDDIEHDPHNENDEEEDDENEEDEEEHHNENEPHDHDHENEEEDEDEEDEEEEEEQNEHHDDLIDSQIEATKTQNKTRSSSSSGRSSDKLYQMDYEKMTKIMLEAIKYPKPKNPEWKPLKMWIRYNEEIDHNASYYLAPMSQRIAGSCHELLVAYLKSSKGEICTRLIKLARDPDEDNQHHFETERIVAQYLSRIAICVNRIYHSRTDVCIWPVETIYFEYNNQMKWATCQAPFLPEDNSCFVKIEPNSGRPCVHDPIVGRYQHCFAAITRGLNLVRDWQGYGVNQSVFLKQCEKYCPEACLQIRKRINSNNVQVLVVIDPVLTTCTAHYETNNPTDFGIKALDEWLETHDCKRCRCTYFNLMEPIQFGIGDPGQDFFINNSPQYMIDEIKKCRKDLDIWDGDDFIPPNNVESKLPEKDI